MFDNDNQLDYRAIQRRADAAVKRQQQRARIGLFAVNALLYVVFMIVIWMFFITRDFYSSFEFAAISGLSAGWTVGLVLHGAMLWLSSERGTRRLRERFIAREIAREMDEQDIPLGAEKQKRRHLMDEIDDDDELVDYVVQDERFREDTR